MSDWLCDKLGNLVTIQKGRLTKQKEFPEYGFKQVINTEALSGNATIWGNPSNALMCNKDDILMLWDDERSGLVAFGYEGIVGSTFALIKPRIGVNPFFLYYYLSRKFSWIQNQRTGSGVPHVPSDLHRIFEVNFPTSIKQQEKIAYILSNIDKCIKQTEKTIEKYKAIKTGMMQDLYTRGIDVDTGKLRPTYKEAPELYKQTELGWIPKDWEIVTIGSFAKIKGGKRMPAGREFSDLETPYPYLRVTDMQDGTINQADIKYVPIEIEPIIRSYKISKDDVYVTIAGTLGLFGIIPDNLDQAQLTENAARITEYDKTQFSRDFIKHQCNSLIIQQQVYREIGVGGGVPKLALYRIARFRFIKPSINEQSAICKRIKTISEAVDNECINLVKTQSIKQGLMSDLLTGKVRVTKD